MTEPDPQAETLAALAIQVATLRGSLSLTKKELNKKIDALGETVKTVVDALDAASTRGPAAPCWLDLDEETRASLLDELAEWVTSVLIEDYPSCALRECWRNHPQVIWELGNIWTEWKHIYDQKRPPIGLALDWHDRWLPNALRRITEITRNCTGECVTLRRRR